MDNALLDPWPAMWLSFVAGGGLVAAAGVIHWRHLARRCLYHPKLAQAGLVVLALLGVAELTVSTVALHDLLSFDANPLHFVTPAAVYISCLVILACVVSLAIVAVAQKNLFAFAGLLSVASATWTLVAFVALLRWLTNNWAIAASIGWYVTIASAIFLLYAAVETKYSNRRR
jgi:hypothetical protein